MEDDGARPTNADTNADTAGAHPRHANTPDEAPGSTARTLARETRALRVSLVGSAAIGVVALVWGLLAGAQVLVFDGVYMLAGLALTAASMLASRAAWSRPSRRFPFGKHALTPLTVAMQGAALLATLLYGAVEAVGTIVAGGSEAGGASVLMYGVTSWVAAVILGRVLRRLGAGSDLVAVEIVSWRAGAVLSLVVAAGGLVALGLAALDLTTAARFVDPVLVLVAVAVVVRDAVGLVRDGTYELLEGAPAADVRAHIDDVVARVRADHGLPEPLVRATKLGRRLYVEIDFVVERDCWTVDEEDAVRLDLVRGLATLPYEVWEAIDLTTRPELAE